MLVTVSTHYDLSEAAVARSLLAHHGIPVFLFDDHLGRMSWLYLRALGGIRLMVPERDAELAANLLSDLSAKIDVPEDEHCPACGSDEIFRPALWRLLLLTGWLFFVPLQLGARRYRCRSCHHSWRAEEGFPVSSVVRSDGTGSGRQRDLMLRDGCFAASSA